MTVEFLKELLYSSGEILRDGFGQIKGIDSKQDQSNIVTEFDFQSESHIRDVISSTYPTHNILGEEHGFENKKSEYTWIIDPLDGTSNFAANIPWFGILIALLRNNKPVLSGAYLPMSDELYFATKGNGAFKNDRRIQVSKETKLSNLLCCYSLDFNIDIRKTSREVEIIKNLVQNCRNLRSTNSLLDFCFVAEGKFGATINQSMKIWDIAAPELILSEAGAKVTDANGRAIVYTPSDQSVSQNYTAAAANPVIHSEIMQLMHVQS
jgi:myo-inositol-1(or 4)-monophosphatase